MKQDIIQIQLPINVEGSLTDLVQFVMMLLATEHDSVVITGVSRPVMAKDFDAVIVSYNYS